MNYNLFGKKITPVQLFRNNQITSKWMLYPVVVIISFCLPTKSKAQYVELYSSELSLKNVVYATASTKERTIYDPVAWAAGTGFTDFAVVDYVELFFDQTMNVYVPTDLAVNVIFEIRKYPLVGTPIDVPCTLRVSYSSDNLVEYIDKSFFTIDDPGYYKIKFRIISIKDDSNVNITPSTLPLNLKMVAGIKIERYFDFAPAETPDNLKIRYLDNMKAFRIKDFDVDGALFYDLEWTFVDDIKDDGLTGSFSTSEIQFMFKNNATRIRVTPNAEVYIPAIFDRGYLIVRARGVGPSGLDVHKLIEGQWSLKDPYDLDDGIFEKMDLVGVDTDFYIKIEESGGATIPHPHMKDMSWMVQTSYAEQGKMKFVVQYYDATGRVRQTATMANTEKEALLTETIYDKQGRAVFQSLPAPAPLISSPIDGFKSALTYYTGINQLSTGEIYDKSSITFDPSECLSTVPALGTGAGAGQYYSEDNPKKNEFHAYIPNGGGYPFTFTEYLSDNTGRVNSQSGVGEIHSLGNGHEVSYLYGTPDQPELDRLFGPNVGLANHYFKSAVIDPNGQVSVSYTDMDGHVIATALAGPSPSNLDDLEVGESTAFDASQQEMTVDLLGIDVDNPLGTFNLPSPENDAYFAIDAFIVPTETEYHFTYSAVGAGFIAECLSTGCFDCIYDIEISLTDPCGTEYLNTPLGEPFKLTLGDMPEIGDAPLEECPDPSYNSTTVDDEIFTVLLQQGSYTLKKTITLNQEAMDIHTMNYIAALELSNPECFETLGEVLEDAEGITFDCELDCSYCDDLPLFPAFLASEFPSPEIPPVEDTPEYDFYFSVYEEIKAECDAICNFDPFDPCYAGLQGMLVDVSPGGQYGEYINSETGVIDGTEYPLSVYNITYETNLLQRRGVLTGADVVPYYRNPKFFNGATWASGYFVDGVRIKVDLSSYDVLGIDLVDVIYGDVMYQDYDGDGDEDDPCVYPENLQLPYFIENFQLDWAYSIICYHPEYYYYQECILAYACSLPVTPADEIDPINMNTYQFDEVLYTTLYEDVTNDWRQPHLLDPLFLDGGCEEIGADSDDFLYYLEHFQYCDNGAAADDVYNIYQAVYIALNSDLTTDCGSMPTMPTGSEDITDVDAYGLINSPEAWLMFINFYRSAKLKYLNWLAHSYAQGDLGTPDAEPDRFGLNLSVGNDEYWVALTTTLNLLPVDDYWIEITSNNDYLPFLVRSGYLQDKMVRFPDVSWHNGIPPSLSMDDPLLDEMAAEAAADVDYLYYTYSGNKPLSFDLEVFLNSVLSHSIATTTDWRTTDYDVLDISGLSERLYTELDARCLNEWNVEIDEEDYPDDKLVWTTEIGACTPDPDCTENYIIINPSEDPEIDYTWNDEIISFHDIHIIDETLGTFTIILDILVDDITKTISAYGKTCFPVDMDLSSQTHCDLTADGNAIWGLLNYIIADPSHDLNDGTGVVIADDYVEGLLESYLGVGSGPYRWKLLTTGEYELYNNDNSHAIRISTENALGVATSLIADADDEELITLFHPNPEIGIEGFPTTVGYIDMFTLKQENPAGVFTTYNGTVKFRNTPPDGGTYYLHSYPVSECGRTYILNDPCDEAEHFSAFDLNDLLSSLLGGAEEFTIGEHISLEDPTMYAGWTAHLSAMMGGSDIEEEFLFVEDYTGTSLTLKFQTKFGLTYTDLCTVTLNIPDEDALLTLEEISSYITLFPHEELAVGGVVHDFTLECTDELCSEDEMATIIWGHVDCLGLKGCPCPDRSVNGSFYYSVEPGVIHNSATNTVTVVGVHPVTGAVSSDAISVAVGKPVQIEIQSYLKIKKIKLTAGTAQKFKSYAFGKNALVDTIWADTTGDTSIVYLKLDGYDISTTPGISTGTDCSVTISAFPMIPDIDPCLADQLALALTNAHAHYDSQVDSMMTDFKEKYKLHCMENVRETLFKTYNSAEYHYTLYYYDQAGDLTMTVPPAGLDMLNGGEQDAMADYRSDNTNTPAYPEHNLKTEYRYNSLNQLTLQTTPDAGESRFWYDYLGRIILSQNAEQAKIISDDWKFSYTLYDELGRIYEVGELTIEDASSDLTDIETALESDANFLTFVGLGDRNQVTNTYYSEPLITVDSPFGTDGQQNLRNRVSGVTVSENPDTDPETYDYNNATHYSYDIHGNVNILIQDYPDLGLIDESQEFKRMDYSYDLISGNVLQVSYQDNLIDQFYHRYKYDADNRIYEVQTSRDGWIWEKEARYFYYRHGPLARVETGDLIVQGTDYAYTIQGWLKGVNAGALIPDRDMGKDGYTVGANPNKYIAQDAFGFALYYFDDDYEGINDGGSYKFLPNLSGSYFNGVGNSLYNGNIMAMSTALLKPLDIADADGYHDKSKVLGKVYQYDQLNRIMASTGFEKTMPDAAGFTWGGGTSGATNQWATNYEYDGNGNLLKMKRTGNTETLYDMDDLDYNYYPNTNKLRYVADSKADGVYDVDVDDQFSIDSDVDVEDTQHDIYQYDAIGNLKKDVAEGIDQITWTVYGKIKKIKKIAEDKLIEFTYDPMGNRISKKVGAVDGTGEIIYTYYVRDAQGNTMAVYNRTEDEETDEFHLIEQHVYGSSRLGLSSINIDVLETFEEDHLFNRTLGAKRYELVNHLGNVLAVISDRRLAFQNGTSGNVLMYESDVITAQDYDPFGMALVGRNWSLGSEYRYGFNGQEQDDEIYGNGNLNTAEFWEYDVRLGRRWNIDPCTQMAPGWTPYRAFFNNPILYADPNGLYEEPKNWFQRTWNYLSGNRHKNQAYDLAQERQTQVNSILDGGILIIPSSDGSTSTALIKPSFLEDVNVADISIMTPDQYFYDFLVGSLFQDVPQEADIINYYPIDHTYAEELEGLDLIAVVKYSIVIKPTLMGPKIRVGTGWRNGVYAKLRNGLPYIGKSFNILTRYSAWERNISKLKTVVSNVNNKDLLRAVEKRMYDYLKYTKGVKIDNKRSPMNAKDYAKYYDEVEELLKGTEWQKMLDDIFGL